MQQTWDASLYAGNGRFVAILAESLVEALRPQPGERILDLGCGDGFLTRRIAQSGATLVGVDNSPQMVAAAKERGADARYASGESLSFNQEFDAVFSNAALHWMSDQDAVLRGVYRALKPGGRFVAECGGQGNIAAIRVALLAVLTAHGIPPARIENNRFFGCEEYRERLEPGLRSGGNHADTASDAATIRNGRMARNLPAQCIGATASPGAGGRHRPDRYPAQTSSV
jgi:SAM-dependent methyltransferase